MNYSKSFIGNSYSAPGNAIDWIVETQSDSANGHAILNHRVIRWPLDLSCRSIQEESGGSKMVIHRGVSKESDKLGNN